MDQFLVIIRGAPASGKTTIARRFRDPDKRVVWLKVDNFKDFFSEDSNLSEQKYVDECALATLSYLLSDGFSVVMEKIFYDPFIIPKAVSLAKSKGVKVLIYQIRCPLEVLLERDKNRAGVREGFRKPLGDETVKKLFEQLENTFYSNAKELDTSVNTEDECVEMIRSDLK
jgi:chloramphenicol 3-O-phosphotransferase